MTRTAGNLAPIGDRPCMFTKQHEQELSEIKALTRELGERFEQVVEQLARIQEAQDQLAAQSQPATADGNAAPARDTLGAGTKAGKRRTKAHKRQARREAVTPGSDEG